MSQPTTNVELKVDFATSHQTIDGFGVNINSKYWNDGKLVTVMETLVDDLGATLFRIDAYGKANWIDPGSELGPAVLNPESYRRVYAAKEFQDGAAVGRWLNGRGIEPYIAVTGVVPRWMCDEDGLTLRHYDLFGEMVASYAAWLRKEANVRFTLLGPLNETDLGPPEGPKVPASELAQVLAAVLAALDRYGLPDIMMVAAEQALYNLEYLNAILAEPSVAERVGVFAFHCYENYSPASAVERVKTIGSRAKVWMTEYGDLDQSGEREWLLAWKIFGRLMDLLEGGMTAALNWDAFDNYHDHDEFWCIHGLIRTALNTFTPKKRFFACRQMYRFVRPGFVRVGVTPSDSTISAQAFLSPDGKHLSVVGMHHGTESSSIGLRCHAFSRDKRLPDWQLVQTTADDNCASERMRVHNMWGGQDLVAEGVVRPRSIFTITNIV